MLSCFTPLKSPVCYFPESVTICPALSEMSWLGLLSDYLPLSPVSMGFLSCQFLPRGISIPVECQLCLSIVGPRLSNTSDLPEEGDSGEQSPTHSQQLFSNGSSTLTEHLLTVCPVSPSAASCTDADIIRVWELVPHLLACWSLWPIVTRGGVLLPISL